MKERPVIDRPELTVWCGDAGEVLRTLPAESVHCCVTSPPYWGLRDYGVEGQIGLEPTVDQYIERLVAVFREVRRVLRADGTLWLVIGSTYCSGDKHGAWNRSDQKADVRSNFPAAPNRVPQPDWKPKDMVPVPWLLGLALRQDGWFLRQDIIWAKPNPLPESVTDRCTRSHEYVLLLSKSARYYFDYVAILEEGAGSQPEGRSRKSARAYEGGDAAQRLGAGLLRHSDRVRRTGPPSKRRRRSVWTIALEPYSKAHFAVFPPSLVELCILAGSPEACCSGCGAPLVRRVERVALGRQRPNRFTKRTGEDGTGNVCANDVAGVELRTTGWEHNCDLECEADGDQPGVVLDPFLGSGTTAQVAAMLGRRCIGIELNPEYIELVRDRTQQRYFLA